MAGFVNSVVSPWQVEHFIWAAMVCFIGIPARVLGASAAKAEQESRAAKSGISNFFMLVPLSFKISGGVSTGF